MSMKKIPIATLPVLVALVVLSASQILTAQEAVSGVNVMASVQTYSGKCPAKIKFTGTIEVTKYPMTFNYQWERSDGAKGPKKVVRVPSAKTKTVTVVDYWQVGAKGEAITVSAKLRVRTGNLDLTSAPAEVTVNCK